MHQSHAPEERPLYPSATCGLTAAEVSARVDAGLDNRFTLSHRSVWEIVRSNVLTLFNAIVVGCFVVLLLLGDGEDALFGTLLVIGMIALWLLVVRSRPLTLLRISVVAAMCLMLLLVFVLPATAGFFEIEWSSGALLFAGVCIGAAGGIAIEIAARLHARRFPDAG